MAVQKKRRPVYAVAIHEEAESGDVVFTFWEKGTASAWAGEVAPKRVPQFIVRAKLVKGKPAVQWDAASDDPPGSREYFIEEATAKFAARVEWISRANELTDEVEAWVRELGWQTRRIEKRIEDSRVGAHTVPALLMQKELAQALLEPISPLAPGAEGVVDLYLLPAYDDIATLYFSDSRWNVHFNLSRGTNGVVPAAQAEAFPLSKKTLEKVLGEMTRHAA
jgi:hypothetical protein